MGRERKKIELHLHPLDLVVAILSYVIAKLPHTADESPDQEI